MPSLTLEPDNVDGSLQTGLPSLWETFWSQDMLSCTVDDCRRPSDRPVSSHVKFLDYTYHGGYHLGRHFLKLLPVESLDWVAYSSWQIYCPVTTNLENQILRPLILGCLGGSAS